MSPEDKEKVEWIKNQYKMLAASGKLKPMKKEKELAQTCRVCHTWFNDDWATVDDGDEVPRYKKTDVCVHCVDAHGDARLGV